MVKGIDIPLAEFLRPHTFDEVIGQDHILGNQGLLASLMQAPYPSSVILWGPPGCGKTTLARLAGKQYGNFHEMSAIETGVADIRSLFQKAVTFNQEGQKLFLFIDEIHRFNRSQQDIFLHALEKGDIILWGATTENPSFELNNALLSRCQVVQLKALSKNDLKQLMEKSEAHFNQPLPLTPEARETLIGLADGDGRFLLNSIALLMKQASDKPFDHEKLHLFLQKRPALYDKNREAHYDLISILHKAIRASDVDAALYWLSRMLQGGEDPLYILRRLLRCALEDIGLADPQALLQAQAADSTYRRLGSPEGDLALYHLVVYLSTAPKSNSVYKAMKAAQALSHKQGSLRPPLFSLNAPTKAIKAWGYGEGYIYDHDLKEGVSGLNYFPETLERHQFYKPAERGFEREITKRLAYWDQKRKK